MSTLDIREEGEADLVVSRRFSAPPERVFRAHVEPEIIRRWMNVGEGWTMEIVLCDARPGGGFCYAYANGAQSFRIEGTFLELDPPGRILHVERMVMGDGPAPETRIETRFAPEGGGTRMLMRMSYPDAAARAAALEMGMGDGMATTYDALEALEAA